MSSDTRPFPPGGRLALCGGCGAVQKPYDDRWRAEAEAIYRSYDMYAQAGGSEQRVFDPTGTSRSRSARLLASVLPEMRLGERGSLLDVGCGTGATLQEVARQKPGWNLYGHDLDDRYLSRLREIPGFVELLAGTGRRPSARFDVVTLIHSLEHLPEPRNELVEKRSWIEGAGWLLIQVPDAEASPFDLVVADHLCHFDAHVLARLAERAGYAVHSCDTNRVPKEISLLARPGAGHGKVRGTGAETRVKARLESQIAWLRAVLQGARSCAREPGGFGIFGTAIAGTWLFGGVDERADFFVDEDPARVGRMHCGRPILAPEDVPADARIYVPLLPEIAVAVAERHSHLRARLRLPPPLDTRRLVNG